MSKTPFESFNKKNGINYDIYRNSVFIGTAKGIKTSDIENLFIQFPIDSDIQIDDVVKFQDFEYTIFKKEEVNFYGKVKSFKAFYKTENSIPLITNNSIFNISNASNSIIGNQQSATINYSNLDFEQLKQLIELYGQDDKPRLYELLDFFKNSLNENSLLKSSFLKFSDLFSKYSWLLEFLFVFFKAWTKLS